MAEMNLNLNISTALYNGLEKLSHQ